MKAFKCDRCEIYYDKKDGIDKVPFTVNRYDTNKGYYYYVLTGPCVFCHKEEDEND